MQWVQALAELIGEKQREFYQFYYGAGSWTRCRKVIAKLEVTEKGENQRYIVCHPVGDKQHLYGEVYCAKG